MTNIFCDPLMRKRLDPPRLPVIITARIEWAAKKVAFRITETPEAQQPFRPLPQSIQLQRATKGREEPDRASTMRRRALQPFIELVCRLQIHPFLERTSQN